MVAIVLECFAGEFATASTEVYLDTFLGAECVAFGQLRRELNGDATLT